MDMKKGRIEESSKKEGKEAVFWDRGTEERMEKREKRWGEGSS